MKQLSSVQILNVNGGDRVSFTFDDISETGDPISQNNKESFYAVDAELKQHIDAIRQFIRDNKF